MTTAVEQHRKPLNPNAIPFWSPKGLRRTPRSKATTDLNAQAPTYIDPATALQDALAEDLMEEFVIESALADAVLALGIDEQNEANEALTHAQNKGLVPQDAPVTDAEIAGEGEEFVIGNLLLECEETVDPEADPREGLNEATAAMEHYGGAPLPTPTPSEIEADGELFVMENELAELEADEDGVETRVKDSHDEPSAALEVMDAMCEFAELDAEEALADAVREIAQTEQAEADAAADEAEMQDAAEEFALEVELTEAALDGNSDDDLVPTAM